MAETPIEAAAREVRLLLVTSGAINDYDAHYSGQKIVSAYLQACLADPVTVERVAKAIYDNACEGEPRDHLPPWEENPEATEFCLGQATAAIKALIDDQ